MSSCLRGHKGHYAEAPRKVEDTKSTLAGRHQKPFVCLVRIRDLLVWGPFCPLCRGEAEGWEVLASSLILWPRRAFRGYLKKRAVGPDAGYSCVLCFGAPFLASEESLSFWGVLLAAARLYGGA